MADLSTAALFVEAVDTAVRLGWAFLGWLIFLSTVAAILLLTATATSAWAVDATWEWLRGRWRRRRGFEAAREPDEPPRAPRARTAPRRPKWANTQPIDPDDIEEAA